MWICECDLVGISDLMFSKHVAEKKLSDETHDQFEERTWQQKVHIDKSGQVFIPPFALKNGLESSGKWLSEKIAGEGKKTYTDRLHKGILVADKLLLTKPNGKPITIDDIEPLRLFVPSDGKRGSAKRVFRIFPTLHDWQAHALIHVFDGKLTEDMMRKHLEAMGKFIGFLTMRVENGGTNGRFEVHNVNLAANAAA